MEKEMSESEMETATASEAEALHAVNEESLQTVLDEAAADEAAETKVRAITQPDDPRPAPPAEEPKAEEPKAEEPFFPPTFQGTKENPIGVLDPAKPFHWSGRNIMDVEFQGSADDTAACYAAATLAGAVMCNPRANPDYKDPNPIIQPEVAPTEYQRGWNDADAAYQDLKALVQNFAAVQAAETNDDVDQKYPFVAYVRHNR